MRVRIIGLATTAFIICLAAQARILPATAPADDLASRLKQETDRARKTAESLPPIAKLLREAEAAKATLEEARRTGTPDERIAASSAYTVARRNAESAIEKVMAADEALAAVRREAKEAQASAVAAKEAADRANAAAGEAAAKEEASWQREFPKSPKTGDRGTVSTIEIVQVLDENALLGNLIFIEATTRTITQDGKQFQVPGPSQRIAVLCKIKVTTKDLIDGKYVQGSFRLEMVGTHRYGTANGGSNTVPELVASRWELKQ